MMGVVGQLVLLAVSMSSCDDATGDRTPGNTAWTTPSCQTFTAAIIHHLINIYNSHIVRVIAGRCRRWVGPDMDMGWVGSDFAGYFMAQLGLACTLPYLTLPYLRGGCLY